VIETPGEEFTAVRGEAFVLRSWRAGDEDGLVRHANDRRIWRNMSDEFPHPYTYEEARRWIQQCTDASNDDIHYAIVTPDGPCGGVGLRYLTGNYRHTAEIGYWLGAAHWGHGLTTRVVKAFTHHAFTAHGERLERVHARVFEWNPASCRVLEKAGYAFEGTWRHSCLKDGEIADVHIYSMIRPDFEE
jgi:ribosomal-protein-alanine N-acetyltransferase